MAPLPDDNQDTPKPAPLSIRPNGALVFGDVAVGSVTDGLLIVNLGWAKAAGLGVRILDDPEVERHRGGVFLERRAK